MILFDIQTNYIYNYTVTQEVTYMSKICIVTDSSAGVTQEEAKNLNILIAPLSIIVDEVEYQDQVNMSAAQLIGMLKDEKVPTTAQPNLGLLDTMMEQLKEENYDHILVISLSSHLSGTYQAFRLAADTHEMDNVEVVDALTLAGPVKDIVIAAAKMAKENKSKEEILAMTHSVIAMTKSYLFPNTLDQLKRGGRVSSTVAALSSLLKIKPLLLLENAGTTIEKNATARTDAKIFDLIIKGFKEDNIEAGKNKLHILHCEGLEIAERFAELAKSAFGEIELEIAELPAVLAAHAGIKSIAVQSSLVL